MGFFNEEQLCSHLHWIRPSPWAETGGTGLGTELGTELGPGLEIGTSKAIGIRIGTQSAKGIGRGIGTRAKRESLDQE